MASSSEATWNILSTKISKSQFQSFWKPTNDELMKWVTMKSHIQGGGLMGMQICSTHCEALWEFLQDYDEITGP